MIPELRQKVVDFWNGELEDARVEEELTHKQLIESVESVSPEARKEYHRTLQYRDMVILVARALEENLMIIPSKQARRAVQ